MTIDRPTLDHLARLARLGLSEAERERFAAELERTLAMVARLQGIDVEGVAPLAHPNEPPLPLRADAATEPDQRDALLALAPEAQGGYFLVPRVVE